MFRFFYSLPLLTMMVGLNACSSVDPTETSLLVGSSNAPAELRAYCDGELVLKSHTLDYGSAQHPFALSIPYGDPCRFQITYYPDDAQKRRSAMILFRRNQAISSLIAARSSSIDFGRVDLPGKNMNTEQEPERQDEPESIRIDLEDGASLMLEVQSDLNATYRLPPPKY